MCQVFGGRGLGVGYPQLAIHPQLARFGLVSGRSRQQYRMHVRIIGRRRLVAVIEEAARAEAAAGALRLAAIGELTARRVGDDDDDPRAWWACDLWDSAAAEVAAAMNISHRKASGQMRIAETLRDHLPGGGRVVRPWSAQRRVVSAITWRTRLITDEQVWARDRHRAIASGRSSGVRWPRRSSSLRWMRWCCDFDPDAVIASQCGGANPGLHRRRLGGRGTGRRRCGANCSPLMPRCWTRRWRRWWPRCVTTIPARPGSAARMPWVRWPTATIICRVRCGSPTCPRARDQPAPKSSVVVNVCHRPEPPSTAAQSASTAGQPARPADRWARRSCRAPR